MSRIRYDLDERLPYLINRVGNSLVDFAMTGLRRYQLTIPAWRVLAVLAYRGELRQIDVSEATSLDPPTVSRAITGAVKKGLVTRTRSNTSNREVTVRLTKKGQAAVDTLLPQLVEDEREVFAGVSKEELDIFKTILRRMYDNIAAYRPEHGKRTRAAKPRMKP